MAPPDLLPDVLGVPSGSATPLALANPSAASVVLLLDARFQQQQRLWVHPLTNTATTVITPAGLETFLRSPDRLKHPIVCLLSPVRRWLHSMAQEHLGFCTSQGHR